MDARAGQEHDQAALELTVFGRSFVALALAGGLLAFALATVLPAARLLPVLAMVCVGALALAPWLALRNLRGLRLRAPAPRTVFAGETFDLRLGLERPRGPARDLVLHESVGGRRRPRPAGFLASVRGSSEVPITWRLPLRGHLDRIEVSLSSTFPFGLVERRLVFGLPADLTALPVPGTLRGFAQHLVTTLGAHRERRTARQGVEEFRALREWREGESQRRVHWITSARRGQLVLRELEGEERPPVHLILWGWVSGPTTGAAEARPGERHHGFEQAVQLAATVAEGLVRRRYRWRFSFMGAGPTGRLGRAGGSTHDDLLALLRDLALVEAEPAPGRVPGRLSDGGQALVRRGESFVLVWAGGGEEGPASGERPAGLERLGWVLDVEDPRTRTLFSPFRRGDVSAVLAR